MKSFREFICESPDSLTLSKVIKHYKSKGWIHHSTLKGWGDGRGTRNGGSYNLHSVSNRDSDGRPIEHYLTQSSRGTVRVRDGKSLKDTFHTSLATINTKVE